MADELISRQAALKKLLGEAVAKYPCSFIMGLAAAADELKKLPAVDAVPVVRCKECKHSGKGKYEVPCHHPRYELDEGDTFQHPDFFCALGERREENG